MKERGAASYKLEGEELHLLPERAIWWPEKEALLVADLHLGKSGHFRSHGIAIPRQVNAATLLRLQKLLKTYQPKEVLFLGDLFHSTYNKEWEDFKQLLHKYPSEYFLIQGNHDILPIEKYVEAGIQLKKDTHLLSPFLLSHEPLHDSHQGPYVLAGHIHPGVRLVGMGRQKLSLPCFYFGKRQAIMPAFGNFTGLYLMEPEEEDCLFAIVDQEVMCVFGDG